MQGYTIHLAVGRIDIRSIIKNSKQYNQNIEMYLERT